MEKGDTPKTLADLQSDSGSLRDSFAVDANDADIKMDALHITQEKS